MIARPSLVLSIVALSLASVPAGPAWASDFPAGPSRAEVKAEVMQARARGELLPAGQRSFVETATGRGTGARADVKAAVLEASARGELMPAGDRPMTAFAATTSIRARAEVKDEVKQAQADRALAPAGERLSAFEPASDPARTYRARAELTASTRR